MSPNVKTIALRIITSFSGRFMMDLQIKLFSGLDRGNHVIIITRGSVDIDGFRENLRPEYWPPTNRVALVSESDPQDYSQLCVLSTFLSNRAIKNAVFKDTKTAVHWLAEIM